MTICQIGSMRAIPTLRFMMALRPGDISLESSFCTSVLFDSDLAWQETTKSSTGELSLHKSDQLYTST